MNKTTKYSNHLNTVFITLKRSNDKRGKKQGRKRERTTICTFVATKYYVLIRITTISGTGHAPGPRSPNPWRIVR